MKKFLLLLSLALLAARLPASVCFDSFADASARGGTKYAVGSYLFNQANGFGNVWFAVTNTPTPPATGLPTIVAGGLSYPGFTASAGNSVSIPSAPGVMGRLTLNFNPTKSGAFYYAFLLKVTDLGALDDSGTANNYFAAFGDRPGAQNAALVRAAARLYAKKSGNGFKLGVARNSNEPGDWAFDTTEHKVNDVLLVIVSYDYHTHTANLWVDPAAATFGGTAAPPPTVTAKLGEDLNKDGIRAFVLGSRTEAPPACLVADLRIGTSWALVTGGLAIAAQPQDFSVATGTSATFSVMASGAMPLAYEWRKNGAKLSDDTKFSGTTTAVLAIKDVGAPDAAEYSVEVSNASGKVTSSTAKLTVMDPSIVTQPVAQVLAAGKTAMFRVVVAGTAPLKYQWQKNGAALADGGNITGANSATLTINNVSPADVGTYSVSVKNGLRESIDSSGAGLFISDPALAASRPNIIFVLCDDMGYGDLGVLFQNARKPGQPRELTPNLDQFAAEGIQLRRQYCPAPVCAPSRASLLLGVHQGHANVRDQQFDKALEDNHTLGSVLRAAGYATAMIGKYGLGGDDKGGSTPAEWPAYPTRRGFDYFYGYERHADGHDHYPKEALYSNKSKEVFDQAMPMTAKLDKCYTADLFTARAKKWIVDQHTTRPDQPFFLYLAFDTPHSVYELPTQAYPAGGGLKGGLQWVGTPGHMINTASGKVDSYFYPDYANATFDDDHNPATPEVPWPETFKRYASSVRRIDDCVGDLKQLLKDLALDTNTIVVFTSDNGPTIEDALKLPIKYRANFFENYGPFDGIKRDTWEGGIRMPTLVRWPGKIAAGSINQTPSQFHDWMTTFIDLAGLPAPARADGVSLVPTLLARGKQAPSTIYVEFDDQFKTPEYPEFVPEHRGRVRKQMQVIGLGGYQGVRYNIQSQSDDFEIYDVVHDPKEATNLASAPGFARLQKDMKDRVLQLRRPDAGAARPYDNELVPAVAVARSGGKVEYAVYEGLWPWVPDTAMLTASASGFQEAIDLSAWSGKENYAVDFKGIIRAPVDGEYTFYLNDDAGATFRLHDAMVIDDDFAHKKGEAIGSIRLQAGLHPFHLIYRHASGASELSLQYSGPGIVKQPVKVFP